MKEVCLKNPCLPNRSPLSSHCGEDERAKGKDIEAVP